MVMQLVVRSPIKESAHGQSILAMHMLKTVMGTLLSVSAFNHERVPMSHTEPPVVLKSSPGGTQHSEQHHVTVSMVGLTVHTALFVSIYAKVHCSNLQ